MSFTNKLQSSPHIWNTFRNSKCRRPLWSENIQADTTITVDIWVVNSCCKCNLGEEDKDKNDIKTLKSCQIMLHYIPSQGYAIFLDTWQWRKTVFMTIILWNDWNYLTPVPHNNFISHKFKTAKVTCVCSMIFQTKLSNNCWFQIFLM